MSVATAVGNSASVKQTEKQKLDHLHDDSANLIYQKKLVRGLLNEIHFLRFGNYSLNKACGDIYHSSWASGLCVAKWPFPGNKKNGFV